MASSCCAMELAGLSQAAAAMARQAAVAPVLVPGVVKIRRRRGEVGGRVRVGFEGVLRHGIVVRAASGEEQGPTVSVRVLFDVFIRVLKPLSRVAALLLDSLFSFGIILKTCAPWTITKY